VGKGGKEMGDKKDADGQEARVLRRGEEKSGKRGEGGERGEKKKRQRKGKRDKGAGEGQRGGVKDDESAKDIL